MKKKNKFYKQQHDQILCACNMMGGDLVKRGELPSGFPWLSVSQVPNFIVVLAKEAVYGKLGAEERK
mgnify:CR=1 FL=1